MGSHCAEDAHRHLEAICHQDRNAFAFDADFAQHPRESGNRLLVLREGQASILTDQSHAIGRASHNVLQRVKDGRIVWGVGWNLQFHGAYSTSLSREKFVSSFGGKPHLPGEIMKQDTNRYSMPMQVADSVDRHDFLLKGREC